MPICFSPLTSRLPLDRTSITVTVMIPVNALLLALSPLPSNGRRAAARFEPSKPLPGKPASPVTACCCCRCGRRCCRTSCSPP